MRSRRPWDPVQRHERKIEPGDGVRLIRTQHCVGYRFAEPVPGRSDSSPTGGLTVALPLSAGLRTKT